MPAFCRHNRLIDNCSICAKKARVDLSAAGGGPSRSGGGKAPPARKRPPAGTRSAPRQPAVTVRRMARAEDDGYDNELVPGLRASADAERLAQALAAAAERLEGMRTTPVTLAGLFAEAGAGGEPPDASALVAGATSPEARFDRAYERLARPGLGRHERVDLLVAAWAHGLMPEIEPWTLRLADAPAGDPVLIAAKRLFGTGDAILLGRRLRSLCEAAGVPVAAAESALWWWQQGEAPEGGRGEAPEGGRGETPEGGRAGLETARRALGLTSDQIAGD